MNKHSLVHRLSLALFAGSLALFGAQGTALAAWTPEFREHAPRYKETFPSAEFALMWGLARYDRPKLRTFKAAKVIKVRNSGTKEPLRILEALHHDDKGQVIKAPLVVFVAGYGSDYTGDIKALHDLYDRGYHVIALPSSTSELYLKAKPSFNAADMEAEAGAAIEILSTEVGRLRKQGVVGEVSFWGESYGAFIGIIVATLDAERPEPAIVDGEFYLIGPSFDVAYTVAFLDQLVEATYKQRRGAIAGIRLLKATKDFATAETKQDVSKESRALAGAMLAYLVNRGLVKWAKSSSKGCWRKISDRNSYYYDNADFYEKFAPELAKRLRGQKGKFVYWLERAEAAGNRRIRMMTTVNDNFNPLDPWPHDDDRILVLGSGAHFGFLNSEWYATFLSMAFPQA